MNVKQFMAVSLVSVALLTGLGACRQEPVVEDPPGDDNEEISTQLTLSNVTLDQPDENGDLLWQIVADQVVYTEDRRLANAENPTGELYEDGEAIFQVEGDQGELRQDGERILLTGNVVATDLRNGAVLEGDELVWIPDEDVLTVRNNVTITHPDFQMTANQARLLNQEQRIEVQGEVRGTSEEPNLRLQAERLVWQVEEQLVVSDRPLRVRQLDENDEVINQAQGNQGRVNLDTNVVTLQEEARIVVEESATRINSELLIWNVEEDTLRTNQPIEVVMREEQVNLTGNQGRIDMDQEIFYLTEDVRAIARRNQSQLTSDRLTWNLATNRILAEGNVNYRQNDPPLNLRGPQLRGTLENQIFVVSGGRVVTEVIPQ